MHGRWRFRIVRGDNHANYLHSGGVPVELLGGDEQALILARGLVTGLILRVEAISVGCPKGITTTRGRKVLTIVPSENGEDWILEGLTQSKTWHPTVLDAVVYAVARTKGYDAEIWITGLKGETTHVVLIPRQRGTANASVAPRATSLSRPNSQPAAGSPGP